MAYGHAERYVALAAAGGTTIDLTVRQVAIEVLADPSLVGPATVFVSGDDEAAKAEVKGLLHDLGWKDEGIMDLGGVRTARGPEHYALLFFEIVAVLKSRLVNIHVTR